MFLICIVEDDKQIRDELAVLLGRNGYETCIIDDFAHAVERLVALEPDLVLLDLNLPGIDGHYICRELRDQTSIPIIVVTSRDSDMDELLSMNFGADDFIAKPYNAPVLLAHIASVIHRVYGETGGQTLSHAGISLDTSRGAVSCGGKSAELTKNEMRILGLLLRSAGQIVSRERIQEELWQSDEFIDDNTLTVNVNRLRTTLGGIGARDCIHTKRGLGYIIE